MTSPRWYLVLPLPFATLLVFSERFSSRQAALQRIEDAPELAHFEAYTGKQVAAWKGARINIPIGDDNANNTS